MCHRQNVLVRRLQTHLMTALTAGAADCGGNNALHAVAGAGTGALRDNCSMRVVQYAQFCIRALRDCGYTWR